MGKYGVAVFLLLTFSSGSLGEFSNKLWNATNVDRLKKDLLVDYDRLTRPASYDTPTDCWIGLTVINMELDETKGVLETHAWMRLNWSDPKMTWDPSQYGGVKQLNLAADEVWQPDVTVYNSAEPSIVDHFAKTNKIAYPNGMVLWVPTAKFKTYCKMDLKYWPFDEQSCIIKVGSWTFSELQINLMIAKDAIETEHYNSLDWEITSVASERHETIYRCCPEPYVDITFQLNFRRRSTIFKAVAIVPAIVVVFMTLVSFLLPPQAGEKLLLNGIACILVCILLMYMSHMLPIMASSSPLLVTFYSHTLYLLGVSFVLAAIVINLSRNQKFKAVPALVRKIFLEGLIGSTLGAQVEAIKESQVEAPLMENKSNDERHNSQATADTKSHLIQNEWIRLAITIDRIAFIVYLIIFILMGFYHFI